MIETVAQLTWVTIDTLEHLAEVARLYDLPNLAIAAQAAAEVLTQAAPDPPLPPVGA